MKYLCLFIFLHVGFTAFAQAELNQQTRIADLTGQDKCAYDVFLQTIKKQIVHPDSTKFHPQIDFKRIGDFYTIGSYADAKSYGYNDKLINIKMYYQVRLKKVKNLSNANCNKADWEIVGMSFLTDHTQAKSNTLHEVAEQYDAVNYLSTDAAFVKSKNKWGFIDKEGRTRIPVAYDSLIIHSLGVLARQNKMWMILDTETGQVLTKRNYSEISTSFRRVGNTRLAAIKLNGKMGALNRECEEIIPPIYDNLRIGGYDHVIGEREGKMLLIDAYTGKEMTPLKYEGIKAHNEELLYVFIGGKVGLIDKTGKQVLDIKYDAIQMYLAFGCFAVQVGGKYALVDYESMKLIGGYIFNKVESLNGDLIKTRKDKLWGVTDNKGNEILPHIYDRIEKAGNDQFVTYKDNKKSTFTKEGKCMENCP